MGTMGTTGTRLKCLIICILLGLPVLFLSPSLIAGLVPFGFWKNSQMGTCTFSANTTVDDGNRASFVNCHWVINSGIVVTINTSNALNIGNLTLSGGGSKIQHATCTTTTCPQVNLNVTGDATIPSGSSINVDAVGYLGGRQSSVAPATVTTNAADTGMTFGFTAGANISGGGSHGGWGGWNSSLSSHVPSNPYEDPKQPNYPGSGGGGNGTAARAGANGGGVIKLIISGNLSLDGTMSANGGTGSCGAGAGGSIWISANTITSATSGLLLTATGGVGGVTGNGAGQCGNSRPAGGGGGGRIAIYYSSLAGTFAVNSTFVQAYGGTQPANANYYGGSGTIFTKSTSQTYGDLYIYGPNNSKYTYNGTPIGVFGWANSVSSAVVGFTAYNRTLINLELFGNLIPDADALTLNQLAIIGNNATSISITGGDLTTMTANGRLWATNDDRHNSFDNIYISDASIVHSAYLNVNNLLSVSNTSQLVASNISAATVNLNDTTTLSHFVPETNYVGRLKITATNMSIATNAKIDVTSLGYLGARRSGLRGANPSNTGLTIGITTTGGSQDDTGGTNGGTGGYDQSVGWNGYFPGVSYGIVSSPTEAGGGGGTGNVSYPGANGGGAVIINLSNTLTIDGLIKANGGFGGGSGGGAGGAGGSIWVTAPTITSSVTALKFSANGGNAGCCGGGGGGRIALKYTTLAGTLLLKSSQVSVEGGTGYSVAAEGSCGTVYSYVNGSSTKGDFYLNGNRYSNFLPSVFVPHGMVSSTTSSTLTDSALVNRGRDFYFTKDQVVGKKLSVNPHLLNTTDFTITDYDASAGKFTLSGDPSGITNGTYWMIKGLNTDYDNFYLAGNTVMFTPYLNATNIISTSDANDPWIQAFRVDATTITLNAGTGGGIYGWRAVNANAPPLPLVVNAQNITIGNSWSIDTIGGGYLGGNANYICYAGRFGPFCANASDAGFTNGNTTTGGASLGAGGSHTSYGGSLNGYIPPTPYGDSLQPFTFGAGGGGDSANSLFGGAGGGIVVINATGTLTVNGNISADSMEYLPGMNSAGAGGSVWITANTISTSKSASTKLFTVNASYTSATNGGGGGGGKIALYYTNLNTVNVNNMVTGGSTSSGGTTGNGNGGAGSAYFKPTGSTYGSFYLDNGGIVPNYLETPLPAYNVTFNYMEVTNNALVKQMSSLNSINVTGQVKVLYTGSMLYVPNNGTINNAGPWTWFTYSSLTGTITEY